MAVGLLVDCFYYELGHSDLVHSFFSTISYHLEKDGWGTKYPLLMDDLYHNELTWNDVPTVKANLKEIEQELSKLPFNLVVWVIKDLSLTPPWEDKISPKVTNLANYFATSSGKTFFEVFQTALNVAEEDKCNLKIKQV